MGKFLKSNKRIATLVALLLLVVGTVFICAGRVNAEEVSINVTYNSGIEGVESFSKSSTYDARLYSALLLNFGDDETSTWQHADFEVINGEETISYKAAFAGWKLMKINGVDVSAKGYFYPDNDFVYMNDAPFDEYLVDGKTKVTSLEVEALWGKTVYVRDKYNFKDIKNVYGENSNVAKIKWNEEVVYADDAWEGNSVDRPVASLNRVWEIMGQDGGKLVVVNHYTIEANDPNGKKAYYAYNDGYKNDKNGSNSYVEAFGKDITNGILTVSGQNLGMDENPAEENKTPSSLYNNATIYVKNTRGNKLYKNPTNGKTEIYYALSIKLNFMTSTVLEYINLAGYRESYNEAASRATSDLYCNFKSNKHHVIEESFKAVKLGNQNNGSDAMLWDVGAKSFGGSGFLQIRSGLERVANDNEYLTIYGSKENITNSFYGVYVNGEETTKNLVEPINNAHLMLNNIAFSYGGITNQICNYNYMGALFVDVDCSNLSSIDSNSAATCTINEAKFVFSGLNYSKKPATNKRTEAFYFGGKSDSSTGSMLITKFQTAEIHIDDGVNIKNLFGGGNQVCVYSHGKLNFFMNGGVVEGFYGGGLGGFVGKRVTSESDLKTEINITINGGTITNLYGGGSGGSVKLNGSGGTINISDPATYTVYEKDGVPRLVYGTKTNDAFPISEYDFTAKKIIADSLPFTIKTYGVDTGDVVKEYQSIKFTYLYPQGKNYQVYTSYYKPYGEYAVSDALVIADIKLDINGGIIKKDVCGGGKNGAVEGNITININNGAKIEGSVYGGGEGLYDTFDQELDDKRYKVRFTTDTSERPAITTFNESKLDGANVLQFSELATAEGSCYNEAVSVSSKFATTYFMRVRELNTTPAYNAVDNVLHIYSPTIWDLGKIIGNTKVNLNGGTVGGSVFGGSNGMVASITGNTEVTLIGTTINQSLFGGGNLGEVSGNTAVTIKGGRVNGEVYGGANQANVGKLQGDNTVSGGNVSLIIEGGTLATAYGGNNLTGDIMGEVTVQVLGSAKVTTLYGGGNQAPYAGTPKVTVSAGTVGTVYGGANQASVAGTNLVINGGTTTTAYGGNDTSGSIDGSVLVSLNGGKVGTVYGGGNKADYMGTGTQVRLNGSTVTGDIYGGGNLAETKKSTVTINTAAVSGNIYGGGYGEEAETDAAKVIIDTTGSKTLANVFGGGNKGKTIRTSVSLQSGNVTNIYGGGNVADAGDTNVTLAGATVKNNLYGGGYQGNITVLSSESGATSGVTTVEILDGNVTHNIYGGGFAGKAISTNVLVKDSAGNVITIGGSVFGGGEGETASVTEDTQVLIDLNYDYTVTETGVASLNNAASGEIKTEVTEVPGTYSQIKGSVFGGGDLGQVGVGTINLSNNTANIQQAGTTKVTVKNGHIKGSVFGGGSGVPTTGVPYKLSMGTVFGSTETNIWGGYIEQNVYGGGTQSRLYTDSIRAAVVNVDQNQTGIGGSGKITIKGSIFGGGDRGNSATTNASVPTTIGNVEVNIKGNPSGASNIYFMSGGVYGDGNLCLVNGVRKIEIKDFNTNQDGKLKTFYSLQRADEVVLNNSEIVLLGAIDLVEEGDTTVYSINRVGELTLTKGSTVKLDQIVKYLGSLESDVATDREFILAGNNGSNGFTGQNPSDVLKEEEREDYILNKEYNDELLEQNTIAVANGLYLEVMDENEAYGPVKGLFTISLLHANPGEGGGFIYADINSSTGDFICVTLKHKDGDETLINSYMNVIDDVGGYANGDFNYYYWFISGPTINYILDITGYIGAEETEFLEQKTIPIHTEKLRYVLKSVQGNDVLKKALDENIYQLVQTENVTGQQIAVEMKIGEKSLGFLEYKDTVFGIKQDGKFLTGHGESSGVDIIENNLLVDEMIVDSANNQFTLYFYKSKDVNGETLGMKVDVDIDMYTLENELFSDGSSTLAFDTHLHIMRLVPEQELYTDNYRAYAGVAASNAIQITRGSAFTAEYQTKYLPSAFPMNNSSMTWNLSTHGYDYYLDELGNYMTLDENGNCINISTTLTPDFDGDGSKTNTVYKNSNGEYYYKTTTGDSAEVEIKLKSISTMAKSKIPARTKITMIDYTDYTPEFYYYICSQDKTDVNLKDFYVMGTKTTISQKMASGDSWKPTFIAEYEKQRAYRLTERLIFIFDYSEVKDAAWAEMDGTVASGRITLQHMYDASISDANQALDIMDYVKSEVNGDETFYSRRNPKLTEYKVNLDSNLTGIEKLEINFKDASYFDIDESRLQVNIREDGSWVNTKLRENEYSLKLELVDENGNVLKIPAGAKFYLDGNMSESFTTGENNNYVVIPIKTEGEHYVDIHNLQNSLKDVIEDIVGEGEDIVNAKFRVSLYSAADAYYYNLINTGKEDVGEYQIIDNPDHSLQVKSTGSNDVLIAGETFDFAVNTKVVWPNNMPADLSKYTTKVDVSLMKKTESGQYLSKAFGSVFTGTVETAIVTLENGTEKLMNWKIADNAEAGTYRLVFTYADRVEYLNFIISE